MIRLPLVIHINMSCSGTECSLCLTHFEYRCDPISNYNREVRDIILSISPSSSSQSSRFCPVNDLSLMIYSGTISQRLVERTAL